VRDFTPSTFGDRLAAIYDEWSAGLTDTDATVALLAELAGDGPVLELGVGTGRLALPLAARGLEVHGVDASGEMLDRLRAKEGGSGVRLVMGDFSDVEVPARFSLVFAVDSTLYLLADADRQLACVANAARHLRTGGTFVVEGIIPSPGRLRPSGILYPNDVRLHGVAFLAGRHEAMRQLVSRLQVTVAEDAVHLYPMPYRYVRPAELDLMAAAAGLHLVQRWGGWHREPLTDASAAHVSIYRLRSGATA
jgi:SAM-dependent methyltransferase